jgi:glycyl-tRNA synthetase beta chain
MGYYYAKQLGYSDKVSLSIKEQYLPNSEDSELPSSKFSAIVALSNKLDSLLSLFSIGKIPTGSKDPYGLRRAVSGIIRIVNHHKLDFSFEDLVDEFLSAYNGLDRSVVIEFFNERFIKILDTNSSILKAVLSSNDSSIYNISQKVKSLNKIVLNENFKDISTTFKRVQNIINDIDTTATLDIDNQLLTEEAEQNLYTRYKEISTQTFDNYDTHLSVLFGLKADLDRFFEEVFVNVDDQNLKTNRKNLIGVIYQEFKKIADIKEITV